MSANVGTKFEKGLYERMMSVLYEEPQYLSVMMRKAEELLASPRLTWKRSSRHLAHKARVKNR